MIIIHKNGGITFVPPREIKNAVLSSDNKVLVVTTKPFLSDELVEYYIAKEGYPVEDYVMIETSHRSLREIILELEYHK